MLEDFVFFLYVLCNKFDLNENVSEMCVVKSKSFILIYRCTLYNKKTLDD